MRLTTALVAVSILLCPLAGSPQELTDTGHAGWISIMPPVVAIGAALILRTVLPALFLGVWLGAWAVAGLDTIGLGRGLLDAFQVYAVEAVADRDHVAIILFSFMIGGLIGIISRNGGTQGIVNGVARWIYSRRHGHLATVFMGLILFVDDYANVLVVGNTMRPITDRLRISREKLAYLVDSTAAPVAAVAIVTTWIGYEVGLIDEALESIGGLDASPYLLFLSSIAYSFYPWLCIVLLLLVSWTGRDIGPMVEAERRALGEEDAPGPAAPEDGHGRQDGRAINAIVPILVFIAGLVFGLYVSGEGETLREIIGSADSYQALMWSSLVAVLVAIAMSRLQGLGTLGELVEHWSEGAKTLLVPMTIVILAWSLAETSSELGTAQFLVSLLGNALPVGVLPALVFVTAAGIAFATGASWGTMAILIPLAVPLAWNLSIEAGTADPAVLSSTIAAVLAGAVFGDHCSPISDTTVMSSMASGCDHIEHVRTQLPYALIAGGTALLAGVIPSGFGVPWWLSLGLGTAALAVVLRVFGTRAHERALGDAMARY